MKDSLMRIHFSMKKINHNRELAKQQGFYDGRYRQKVVKDKKKEFARKWARKNKTKNNED